MSRFVPLALVWLGVAGLAEAGPVVMTAPLVDPSEQRHVVCLVSNLGPQATPLSVIAAGPFSMDELANPDAALPAGGFNQYVSANFAGYCKVTALEGSARGLRVAACLADAAGTCGAVVEGR
jgi:hypothetical protein